MARKNQPADFDELLGDTPSVPAPTFTELPSAEVAQALAKLSPFKTAFVTNLAAGMREADAVIKAGKRLSKAGAKQHAAKLLSDPDVAAALEVIKRDLVKKAEYNFDKFMGELNAAIEFAQRTKNATALVRAVELKGKANGHVVDRLDSRNLNVGFQINIAGVDDAPRG